MTMDSELYDACFNGDMPVFADLVSQNKNVLEQTSPQTRNTVLHIASLHGHVDLAAEIIRLQPRILLAVNAKWETPLHTACSRGHKKLVKLLLANDSSVASTLDYENRSAFFMACTNGHLGVVKLLLNKIDRRIIYVLDRSKRSALFMACSHGHSDLVKLLLAETRLLEFEKDSHSMLLHIVECQQQPTGHCKIFAREAQHEKSCDVGNNGNTILHLATLEKLPHIRSSFSVVGFKWLVDS